MGQRERAGGSRLGCFCSINLHGTTTIFIKLDCPWHSSFWPCTATTQSPALTMPSCLALSRALAITESVPTKEAVSIGVTPRTQLSCRIVVSLAQMAKIGHAGLYLAIDLAVCPASVKTTMSGQPPSIVAL